MKRRISAKAARFTESVIREMTRLANQHGAINLGQGFPDFPAPEALKEAACRAIREDVNQYAITWGTKNLREALARKYGRFNRMRIDPETMITVTCGATEAMLCAMLATVDPGDEVVIFEPFYENFGPDAILSGAVPRFVPLHPPDWTFDEREVEAAFGPRTRAIILNTPNNPTGKVFTRDELRFLADLCVRHDVLAITDEVYEHIVYPPAEHVSMATLEGMDERTITTSALSKTFAVTGWRLGHVVAPPDITSAVRKVHDFATVGAPHPLQEAAAWLLENPGDTFEELSRGYLERRGVFLQGAERAGLKLAKAPEGAYYVMCGISDYGFENDTAFARWLVEAIGVATVPGSSFYREPERGHGLVRFSFCKKLETLREACRRLERLSERVKR